jgi:hypothetical protein
MEEKAEQVAVPRDSLAKVDEFLANDVSAPTFNPTWADSLTNSWVLNGKGAFPGRCQLDPNPVISHRNIYAYVWSKSIADPATNFCFMACQISIYLRRKLLKRIPLYYTLGTMPQNNVLAKSLFTGVLAGGIANPGAIGVTLFLPNQNGFSPEPTMPILLQPYPVNFKCDHIALDVLGWANMYPDQSRFILGSDEL